MIDPIPQKDYYRLLAFIHNVKHPVKAANSEADSTIFAELPSGAGKTLAVREHGRDPPATHVLLRGDAGSPAAEVHPGVLQVLDPSGKATRLDVPAAPAGRQSTGRRRALAGWIARPENPLTARVMANRIWQHHFGQGIVRTPNDFGRAGSGPSHPALLDWLASEFIEQGWSIKEMHRRIMVSNTYRMSSRIENGQAQLADPGNRLLWRQNLRRLDAEAIRDSVMAVAGQLNLEGGGRGMFPRLSGEVVAGQSKPGYGWDVSPEDQRHRRSLYTFVKRGLRDPMMEAFDYVNTTAPLGVRPTTSVAPQALLMLNSGFIHEHSAAMAKRIQDEAGDDPQAQIRRLYRLALGRGPSTSELGIARTYLSEQQSSYAKRTGQITFRPNVPPALYSEYRRKLSPDEFLIGPRSAWSYHAGVWKSGYEGTENIDAYQAPFALWRGPAFVDGTLSGKIKIHHASKLATILIRAMPNGKSWDGYAIQLDPDNHLVTLTRHDGAAKQLKSVTATLMTGVWSAFKLKTEGNRVQFWLGESETPLIDVEDPRPVDRGRIGFSTWGAELSIDELNLEADGSHWEPANFVPAKPSPGSDEFRGWKRSGGDWISSADGSWTIGKGSGAKIIWEEQAFRDGEVCVEMRLAETRAHSGGLLTRIQNSFSGKADSGAGYAVFLDLARQSVRVAGERDPWNPIAETPCEVVAGRWYHLRVVLSGPRMQVYVNRGAEPQIDFTLPEPSPGNLVGLMTTDSEIAYRKLSIIRGSERVSADFRPPTNPAPGHLTAEQSGKLLALQALCKLVFNLNEFLYVD